MSHSFKSYPAKPCFAQFKEPINASDYITQKKMLAQKNISCSWCDPSCCNVSINKNQLYINLITKLQLNNDIPVVINNTTGTAPSLIVRNEDTNPTTKYTIDPSGILFGNDICGINNWQNYVVYNKPKSKLTKN